VAPGEKVAGIKIGVVSALQLLQERLGETQEGMARRLGCTLGAWSKWVRGENTPRGIWMLQILALCPDEETHDAFFVDIGEVGSKIPSISRPGLAKVEKEAPRPGGMRADARIVPEVKIPGKRKGR
jgi:transcriptional regulator with XRE-family HTH domain